MLRGKEFDPRKLRRSLGGDAILFLIRKNEPFFLQEEWVIQGSGYIFFYGAKVEGKRLMSGKRGDSNLMPYKNIDLLTFVNKFFTVYPMEKYEKASDEEKRK